MLLESGALTSEWRVGTESRTVPHTQILAEHLMRTRGKGRRRVRLTTMGPVSEMAPVKKMQLDGAIYWPTYMEIEWPSDRKSTRLNSSHVAISYAVFCLKKKKI